MTIPILDTHQHMVLADRWPYGWTKGIEALEGKPFGYPEYLQASRDTGIAGTIFMETTPDGDLWRDEAKLVLSMADDPDTIIQGAIINCRPEEEAGFEEWVESVRTPRLAGLRRILHVEPDEMSQSPVFVENIRKTGKMGLTFDMCFFARQLPLAYKLASQCPDTQFILDHCGVPDIAGGDFDTWRKDISRVAELPNVACKISGVLAYCAEGQATLEAVRPYVEHSIEVFGWDRVVWGSDWPVCLMRTTLPQWVEISRTIVAGESEANQRKLFHENAERIYKIPLPK